MTANLKEGHFVHYIATLQKKHIVVEQLSHGLIEDGVTNTETCRRELLIIYVFSILCAFSWNKKE